MHYDGARLLAVYTSTAKYNIIYYVYIYIAVYRDGSGGKITHARTENYPTHSTAQRAAVGARLKSHCADGTGVRGPKWKTDGGKRVTERKERRRQREREDTKKKKTKNAN